MPNSTTAPNSPYVITVSSDEGEEEDDVQMLEFHQQTQKLINKPAPKVVKKLSEAECPICFDSIENTTITTCGHLFCLVCIQKSISSSAARGQTQAAKGIGLCPLCRDKVVFKDSVVLKLKKQITCTPFEQKGSNQEDTSQDSDINGLRDGKVPDSGDWDDEDIADLF